MKRQPKTFFLSIMMIIATLFLAAAAAANGVTPMPDLLHHDARYQRKVNGTPYLILPAQVHNSSKWSATPHKVWPAVDGRHANTLLMPIAREQIKSKQGQFDFSFLDTIVKQARKHYLHLALPWFAAWKTTRPITRWPGSSWTTSAFPEASAGAAVC